MGRCNFKTLLYSHLLFVTNYIRAYNVLATPLFWHSPVKEHKTRDLNSSQISAMSTQAYYLKQNRTKMSNASYRVSILQSLCSFGSGKEDSVK